MSSDNEAMRQRYFSEYRQIAREYGISSVIIDSCHDPVLLIENGYIVFANQALLIASGYSAQEAVGLPFENFLAPEFVEPAISNYKKRLAGLDASTRYEVGIITRQGSLLEFEVTAGIIEYDGRKLDLVILRDFSERTRYEKSIEDRDHFLDSIIEQSPNAMWISDKNGNIIRINQALRNSLIITDENVIGSYNVFNDLQVKEQGYLDMVTSVFTEGKTVQFTIDYHTGKEPGLTVTNDSHRIIEIVMAPIFGELNEITNVVCMQKDITDQTIAERSLIESEIKYHSIFNNSYDAILLTTTDGQILAANPAACTLFGRSEQELIEGGRGIIVDTEDPRLDYFIYERKQRGSVRAEMTLVKNNGTKFEAELTSTIFPGNEGGELTSMIIRDVTERTNMERSLESNNRTLRMISECNQSLIRSTEESELLDDICRIITEYGGYLLAWVGFKTDDKEKVVIPIAYSGSGKDYVDGLKVSWAEDKTGSGPTGTALREGVYSLVSNIISDTRFTPWKDRAVEFGFKSALALPLLDFNNTVFGALTIYAGRGVSFTVDEIDLLKELANDLAYGIISIRTRIEREKAEKATRQSEEKLLAIIESIPQGIIVTDLKGIIIQANASAVNLFSFNEPEEIVGKNAIEFALPDYHEIILEKINAAKDDEKPLHFEYTAIGNAGKPFSASMSVAYIRDTEGNPTGIVGLFEDITERLKMQEQLVVTDRLASVGELAAGIAHELNNPLTGVIGFSDLILERNDIPDTVRNDLIVVNQEALRASQVARHLLTFARKHPDQKSPVNVNDIINTVQELRRYDHSVSNIAVITDLQPDIPPVIANEFQLQQVFLNIVINAEYFMKERHNKGQLSITTTYENHTIRIVFDDDGPGIPPNSLANIFNPFFTTKDIGKGTGLGLSISYGIIIEHNGTIRAENRDAGGARFIIELPVVDQGNTYDQSGA